MEIATETYFKLVNFDPSEKKYFKCNKILEKFLWV